jgi:acyl-CoA dehydrogenase
MSIKKSIENKLYNYIKKSMPPISQTEKEAIHAGDTWIEGDLFQGNMEWNTFLKDKGNTLTEEENNFINIKVKELIDMINDYEIDQDNDLPKEIWTYLKKEKFFSMIIPKSYGGLEFSAYANSTIVAKIASISCAVAVTVMVPNSLGPGELLMKYGTDEQKDNWLPKLSNGSEIPCFALTAPSAGSDAGAIPDKGIVMEKDINGEKILGIELNFNKRYITLAPVATLMGLAFKMYDPDNLLGDKVELGITCALIPTDHEGIDNSNRHSAMNISFMNGPIFGENVFIPVEWIIGGKERAGQGWKMLVECLSAGRGISLPALSAATCQSSYRATSAYSYIRKQFGTSIGKFEGVEEALARIAGLNYIVESTRQLTTHSLDIGYHPSVVTAITKYHTTEMARQCINDAMDIHAGKGIIQGQNNYLRNAYLGMPIAITVEGANILTRNLMIFGQGSLRCHPFLLKEMESLELENDTESREQFSENLWKHMAYTGKHCIKSILHSFTFGMLEGSPNNTKLKKYYKKINKLSRTLAITSDFSLLFLGGDLKRKEYLSSRLGDMLSYLYMASAVLKNAENSRTEADYVHAEWALEYLLHKASVSYNEFINNFPSKIVSLKMKMITYPFGNRVDMPNHKLSQKMINYMFENKENSFRNKMSELSMTNGENNPLNKLERAFVSVSNNVELEKKIIKAQKEGLLSKGTLIIELLEEAENKSIITNEEKEKLKSSEKLRWEVINVDHYKK